MKLSFPKGKWPGKVLLEVSIKEIKNERRYFLENVLARLKYFPSNLLSHNLNLFCYILKYRSSFKILLTHLCYLNFYHAPVNNGAESEHQQL